MLIVKILKSTESRNIHSLNHNPDSYSQLWHAAFLKFGGALVAQMVKNLPEMQERWVESRGWEDPLEKGMATHPSILAKKIP